MTTRTHTHLLSARAYFAKAAWTGGGEGVVGGDGARDDARGVGRRDEAAAALRCARGGGYARGSSYGG